MNKDTFVLTPLGAALVEAMPNRIKMQKLRRDFKRRKICPVSGPFPTAVTVTLFYTARQMPIRGFGYLKG